MLAAIVFLIGIDLVDVKGVRRLFLRRRSEALIAVITAVVVCVIGVEQGIVLAVILSAIDLIRRHACLGERRVERRRTIHRVRLAEGSVDLAEPGSDQQRADPADQQRPRRQRDAVAIVRRHLRRPRRARDGAEQRTAVDADRPPRRLRVR